jgi:hypothetical protein
VVSVMTSQTPNLDAANQTLVRHRPENSAGGVETESRRCISTCSNWQHAAEPAGRSTLQQVERNHVIRALGETDGVISRPLPVSATPNRAERCDKDA